MANALEKYFGEIKGLTGFNPEVSKESGKAVMAAINGRNDPSAWLAYAGTAIKQAWDALPKGIREKMRDAINDIIQDALDEVQGITDALSETAEVANAAPIIGQIIGAVIVLVGEIVGAVKGTKAINRNISTYHKAMRMSLTFENYSDPRDWVFKSMKLENYTQYVEPRKQGNWSREPCFGRAGLATDRMFSKRVGASDVGRCGHKNGVKMKCPMKRDFGYEDCERYYKRESQNPSNYCSRHLGISALFYPYWSPAYASNPISNAYMGTSADPNAILMGRQTMLLADPYSNLRVVSASLLDMTDRFVAFWKHALDTFAVDGKKALLKIDENGNAPGTNTSDRYTIDERENPNYTASHTLKNRFYFDEHGRILPYTGMASVNEWGIRASGGSGRGTDGGSLAVSVGAYNAVITNTLAFFTARSSMLRNGGRMRGLLIDHPKSSLDPAVQAAVQYAADKGVMLPGPMVPVKQMKFQAPDKVPAESMGGKLAKPSIQHVSRFSMANTGHTGSAGGKGGSAMPILVGVAALGLIIMKGKK